MKQFYMLLLISVILLSYAGDSTSFNATREIENVYLYSDDSILHFPPDYSFYKLPIVEITASREVITEKKHEIKTSGEINVDTSVRISSYIRQVTLDKSRDILWFATYSAGVGKYDGKKVSYLKMNEGLAGNVVRNIITDRNNNMWFATNGGVSVYDGKKMITYKVKDGLYSNEVWGILEDKNSPARNAVMWFATDQGVCRFDGKVFTKFYIPPADLKDNLEAYPAAKLVNCMFQDKQGTIWFGTNGGGVYSYDASELKGQSKLRKLTVKEGLCDNFIHGINEDRSGNLWFCSRFGGVSRYDGKTFKNFTTSNGLNSNFVWNIFEDRSGNVWFATAGAGAGMYDGEKFRFYSVKDGLVDNYVQSIIEDRSGKIWFGTASGLSSFNGKDFQSFSNVMDGC